MQSQIGVDKTNMSVDLVTGGFIFFVSEFRVDTTTMSIINDDEVKMEEFERERRRLPALRRELEDLKQEQDDEWRRWVAEWGRSSVTATDPENDASSPERKCRAYKLQQKIDALRERITDIESGRGESEYLLRLGQFVQTNGDALLLDDNLETAPMTAPKRKGQALDEPFSKTAKRKRTKLAAKRHGDAAAAKLSARMNAPRTMTIDLFLGSASSPTVPAQTEEEKSFCAGELYERFRKQVIEGERPDVGGQVSEEELYFCPWCKLPLSDVRDEALLICIEEGCGYNISYVPTDKRAVPFGENPAPRRLNKNSYRESNRFSEWLNQSMAEEQVDVTDALHTRKANVVEAVRKEFVKWRTKPEQVNYFTVRKMLQKLEKSRTAPPQTYASMYEHATQIAFRITGIPPLRFTPEQKDTLRRNFLRLMLAWQELTESNDPVLIDSTGKKRSNFIAYAYVLTQLCVLLEYDDFVGRFPLLKSEAKLREHNRCWKRLCEILRWEYYPLNRA